MARQTRRRVEIEVADKSPSTAEAQKTQGTAATQKARDTAEAQRDNAETQKEELEKASEVEKGKTQTQEPEKSLGIREILTGGDKTEEGKAEGKFRWGKGLLITLFIVLLLLLGYLLSENQRYREKLQTASKTATPPSADTKSLLEKVGKLIVLPQGEEPTIATVTDVERLKSNQPFFAQAKNGDKVLIYSNKAILYDPVADKIVEVATINFGTSGTATTSTTVTAQPQSWRFVLRNGTQTVGLTKTYEAKLKKALPEAEVIAKENAKKQDYEKSIIVNVKGDRVDKGKELAKLLNLTVEPLPGGEPKPDADFLIILGSDQK